MKKAILLILLLPMLASAQYFDVFDIDNSDYPIMKAKFYSIDANGKQILNHTPSDFEITENGEPRDVISVSCPQQKGEPFSVVIAVDVSGSMGGHRISRARESIKNFISILPNNGSEVAIIAFNQSNYYVSDFTTNKSKLFSKVDSIKIEGGTNFDAAFISPVAGSLLAISKAKLPNKVIILVTDGQALGNEAEIINTAKSQNTKIYSLIIGSTAPNILANISRATDGKTYIDLITESDFKAAFFNISSDLTLGPCELNWKSTTSCDSLINLNILNKKNNQTNLSKYYIPNSSVNSLELNLAFIKFGLVNKGTTKDTSIFIKAINFSQRIENIEFEPDLGHYKILNPLPILISKNESIELKIKYEALDTLRQYTNLSITTDKCIFDVLLLSGSKYQKTLSLVAPNGGDIFTAGADTNIKWDGVSKVERVNINFSSDNGKNWENVQNDANGLEYPWLVPKVSSDSCLIWVYQNPEETGSERDKLVLNKAYGGSSSDITKQIIQETEGGFIIAGRTRSNDGDITTNYGGFDAWVYKIDEMGVIQWSRTYGGTNNDEAISIQETSDMGYIVLGTTSSNDGDLTNTTLKGDQDIWIFKINNSGDLEWSKTYGGNYKDVAYSIIKTSDNNFAVLNSSNSTNINFLAKGGIDAWVFKINNDGDLVWSKTFGGSNDDILNSVAEDKDGNLILVGNSKSADGLLDDGNFESKFMNTNYRLNGDAWILKLNNMGNLLWSKTFGGENTDEFESVIVTTNNEYAMVGFTRSSKRNLSGSIFKGNNDLLVLTMEDNGKIIWFNTYGGVNSDVGNTLIQSGDQGFIIAGYSDSKDGDLKDNDFILYYPDVWIFKTNSTGKLEWSEVYGGSSRDQAYSIVSTEEGGYIVCANAYTGDLDLKDAGYKGSDDSWLLKFGSPQPLQSDTSDAVFSIIMPEPVIQNNDIDMGQMIVSSTKDTIVSSIICNIGDAPLHVLGVDITGGDTGDFLIPRGAGDFFLNKGECQDMMIEFTPSALGNRTAVATIRTTIGDFKDTIQIRGVGINPVIEATANVVDFGVFELGNGKDTTVVLVKNVGSTDITITDTRISGPDMEQFTLSTTPLSYTIAAGEEKEFRLNYTAKLGGKSNSFLDFHYDGIGSPIRSLLFAEGIGGEVYPQVADAYVGETVNLGIFLGKIKPEGLSEVATNFSATVSYNSTLLATIDKSIQVTTEDNKSYIQIAGKLSGVSQIAAIPMKVGLGTAVKSGLVITEFQLYDANGDSVDYDIEPGVGEFNVLGICEEGGTRLINPNGEVIMQVVPENQFGNARVSLTLIETGLTELEIYDQIGNKVETVYSGTPSTGQQEINLDLSKYASGRYYIKLTTPTITKTEIIEVVR